MNAKTMSAPSGSSQEPGATPEPNTVALRRRRIVRSVQVSFWAGAGLVLGMIVAAWIGGIWVGVAFIPGLIGAYGLFVSSGKLLNEIDRPQGAATGARHA